MKHLSSGLVVLCLATGVAYAAGNNMNTDAKQMSRDQMKACDMNGDMIITKAEAMKCGMTDAQWKEFKQRQQDQLFLNEEKNSG